MPLKRKRKLPKHRIYKIILTNKGKKLRFIDNAKTESEIMKKFNKLLKENKKEVNFHKKWIVQEHEMFLSDYELVVLKVKDITDSDITKVRDPYGKFINYKTTNENWIVLERGEYMVEESFWVYGYHPRLQRKDYKWIMENFVDKDAKDKNVFKSILVFLNKVIIEINGKLEMIICKNRDDSKRLYNKIQEDCKKKKYKYIAFMDDVSDGAYRRRWTERIMELTNWDLTKTTRISTRE